MGQAMITPKFWHLLGRESWESLLSVEEEDSSRGPRKPPQVVLLLADDDDDADHHVIEADGGGSDGGAIGNLLQPEEVEEPPPEGVLLLADDDDHHVIEADGGGSDRDAIGNFNQPEPLPAVREVSIGLLDYVDYDFIVKLLAPAKPMSRGWGRLGPYSWDQKILLVGEGDFSFSASLAVAFGDASNIISTSLDSFEFLMKNYKRALSNILELRSKRCKVMHGVDATKMVNRPQLRSFKFDRIVYNFPHAGFSNLRAPREAQIRMHQRLVSGFMANAKKMIKDDGQIHITHKCIGFSLEWNLEKLGSVEGLGLVEETPFNLRDYPGYSTKYGYGGDRSFDCMPSKRYKFQLVKKEKTQRKGKVVVPERPSIGSSNLSPKVKEEQLRWGEIGPYSGDKKILMVGEGDFSFSASLAAAFGDASNLVATSLDSFEYLRGNYKRAKTNILALTSRRCKVIHGVDATSMAINHPQLRSLKFNYIIFNFPKANFSNPKPPRHTQISKHQELVRGFLANAKKMIQGDGQIHVTHQCFGQYLEWNIEMLGSAEGLQLVEESPFNHREYRDYCVKFGCAGDGGFDCSPSKTYKFQLVASPKRPRRRKRRQ